MRHRLQASLFRCFFSAVALGGAVWVWFILAHGLENRPMEDLAVKLSVGQDFDPSALEAVASRDDHRALCDLKSMREQLAARFELMNLSVEAGEIDRIDARLAGAAKAAENVLVCAPQDSFAWLVRYVVQSRQMGISPKSMASLAASYRYGAREPWIAVRRNKIALAIFDYLPLDLRSAVLTEFLDLLRAYLTDEAVDSFLMAQANVKDQFARSVMTLSNPIKRQFIARAQARGVAYDFSAYDDRPNRPWR